MTQPPLPTSAAADQDAAGRRAARRPPRLFATVVEEPRARQATDAILLVAAAVGLVLLGLLAVPQAGLERALITLVHGVPRGLDGLWHLTVELLVLLSVALVCAALVSRRGSLLRDLLVAGGLALGPSLWAPSIRLAIPSAVVMTASPHLSQPVRRLGRWMVLLGAAATILLGAAAPSAAAAVLIAAVSAAVVHLAFGSARGRPSLADVAAALDGLGVPTRSLGAAARQPTGLFLVDAVDERDDPFVVKVYGRDAYDTQLLRTLWRTAGTGRRDRRCRLAACSRWSTRPFSPSSPARPGSALSRW